MHHYAIAAAAPVLLNITLIAALLIGVSAGGDRAVFLAWGVFAAGVVQFFWLAAECRRIGMRFKWVRPRFTPDVKMLLMRMLPVAFGAGLYQINLVVNKMIATLVGPGAVSWINYADRVNLLPVGIFGTAIGIALLPLLTRQIQAGNEAAAIANQNRAVEISLLLTLPAAAGIAMLAGPITSVLFEHGAFTPQDRVAVASALFAFSFGLPAYVLNKALTPSFFGRHDTKTPVKAAAAALILNIALNLAFMPFMGHVGIALATSISAWLNAGILSVILYRRGYLVPDARLKRRLPRVLLATVIMMAGLWGGLALVTEHFWALFGQPDVASGNNLTRTLALFALIGLGGAIFGIGAMLLGAAQRSDLDAFRRKRAVPPPSA